MNYPLFPHCNISLKSVVPARIHCNYISILSQHPFSFGQFDNYHYLSILIIQTIFCFALIVRRSALIRVIFKYFKLKVTTDDRRQTLYPCDCVMAVCGNLPQRSNGCYVVDYVQALNIRNQDTPLGTSASQ